MAPRPVNLTGLSSEDPIFGLDRLNAVRFRLSNGIPVHWIQSGIADLYKIEVIFHAGYIFQNKNLQASFTNQLLKEGTLKHSSGQIAGLLDQYGAYLSNDTDKDRAGITLFVRSEHFNKVMPLLGEILCEPTFPEEELQHLAINKQQQYLVDIQKVSYLATRKFHEKIFGNDHPYGSVVDFDDYTNLTRNDIGAFFQDHYTAARCLILLAGPEHADLIPMLENALGGMKQGSIVQTPEVEKYRPRPEDLFCYIDKPDAVQNALRIGMRSILPAHPDYNGLKVLNTLLGGYFGSRLMKNIRERKGYTYGIGSALLSYEKAGALVIYSEVASEVASLAMQEILHEVRVLSEKKVDESELDLVRNYLLGSFLRSMDGTFEVASRLKNLLIFGLNDHYYSKYINDIQTITSGQILQLAGKYLSAENMIQLMAGKKKDPENN